MISLNLSHIEFEKIKHLSYGNIQHTQIALRTYDLKKHEYFEFIQNSELVNANHFCLN